MKIEYLKQPQKNFEAALFCLTDNELYCTRLSLHWKIQRRAFKSDINPFFIKEFYFH
jgi:hypothetical protein